MKRMITLYVLIMILISTEPLAAMLFNDAPSQHFDLRNRTGATVVELDGKLFLSTNDGRLLERYWNQTRQTWGWTDHGTPPNARITTAPGAVMNRDTTGIKLFMGVADGRLFERYWDPQQNAWTWTDHGYPPGSTVGSSPGAVMTESVTGIKFFVTAADGRLFERYWDPQQNAWGWTDHGHPPGTTIASVPSSAMTSSKTGIKFFLTTNDGRLFERYWDPQQNAWGWTDHGHPLGVTVVSAPGAVMTESVTGIKLFMAVSDGRLFERYWDWGQNRWGWTDHGHPPGTSVAGAPGAMMTASSTGIKFFLITSNGRLFERYWDWSQNRWGWTDHGVAPSGSIISALGAVMIQPTKFFVLTLDGRLLERYWDQGREVWDWTDHGNALTHGITPATGERWVTNRFYLNQRALGVNGNSMCSMASIAMIRASAGLTNGDFDSLKNDAIVAWNSGLRAPGVMQVTTYLNAQGMNASVIWEQNKNLHWQAIKQEIDKNRPVILNSHSDGGNLTSSGHYIVVVGYRDATDSSARKIIAYDPFGRWTGIINKYDINATTHDTPGSVKGRFVDYPFDQLGKIYSIRASPRTLNLLRNESMINPDPVFTLDHENIIDYEGHGQTDSLKFVFLPQISR